MRKVILDLAITVDGYIEGPKGEIDWCIMEDDMDFDRFLATIDTIFYGRLSYDLWGNFQPASDASQAERNLWENVHKKKKVVFSRGGRIDGANWVSTDVFAAVNSIKAEPGKDIWLYGGANLITTFI